MNSRPSKVNILVILESPPQQGGYMYNPSTRSIPLETVLYALNPEYMNTVRKHMVLCGLENEGILVVDSCLCPVDRNWGRRKKRDFILRCAYAYLGREVEEVKPVKKILVAMKGLPDEIFGILRSTRFADRVHPEKFSFPGGRTRNDFILQVKLARENGEI